MDTEYLNMIKETFNTPYYYFSYTYDLTHTMQRLYNTTESFAKVKLLFILLQVNAYKHGSITNILCKENI